MKTGKKSERMLRNQMSYLLSLSTIKVNIGGREKEENWGANETPSAGKNMRT
jgi:hypothetical protein